MSGQRGEGLSIEILGCGSSAGVPRPGGPDGAGDWGACDPSEPRNRRRRCSILVRRRGPDGETLVLVDTSPDLREQLMAAQVARLDAVLYTHDHADQSHGVDDLRALVQSMRRRIPVYIDDETSGSLLRRFDYCFTQGADSRYRPILERQVMPPCGTGFALDGPGGAVEAVSFLQYHGGVNSLGFRFGPYAYSSDVVGLPEASFEALAGVKIWIVDALQMTPHPTHAHLDRTLEWIARVKPERAVLTNMHVQMDYGTLKRSLPPGVEPAFDGMILTA